MTGTTRASEAANETQRQEYVMVTAVLAVAGSTAGDAARIRAWASEFTARRGWRAQGYTTLQRFLTEKYRVPTNEVRDVERAWHRLVQRVEGEHGGKPE